MVCEHPTCTLEAITICKYHCHLSVCQQHRIEHEQNLLIEFEKQLDDLSKPISRLLHQSRSNLKESEESRQQEIDRVNALFNPHLMFIEQNLKLSKTTEEIVSHKREQLINYQTGDNQLTQEDYQQIQNLSKQIQHHLQRQSLLNNQIRDKHQQVESWSIDSKPIANPSTDIECIEVADSSDEDQSQMSADTMETNFKASSSNKYQRKDEVPYVRGICPLTQYGVFGLKRSHNIPRLCAKINDRPRCLYGHFTNYHHVKSSISNKIVKAIRDGYDPMKTIIFPQDDTPVIDADIPCPFDSAATKFTQRNSIPNTPCTSVLNYHYFKIHLRQIHAITRLNANLIFDAMRTHGTISHVQFEEDLCEIH